ncbi:hypothetical protein GF373_02350, partial [bacterium]|nr:hypothetical protein [bacterium]
MKKIRQNPQSSVSVFFERITLFVLLFQVAATALYFNGYFTNPLVNKYLIGQFTGMTAWFFYLLHCLFERKFTLAKSPYYVPALLLALWAFIRSVTAPSLSSVHNYYIFLGILISFPLWVTLFQKSAYRWYFICTAFFAGFCMTLGCLRQLLVEDPRFHLEFFRAVTLSTGQYERQYLGAFLGHNNASTAYVAISIILAGFLWHRFRRQMWSAIFGVYILVGLLIVYMGGSRSAALGLMAAIVLIVIGYMARSFAGTAGSIRDGIARNKKKWLISGAVLLFFALVFSGMLMTSSTVRQKSANLAKRFLTSPYELLTGTYPRVWWMSLLMAGDNPLTGVGFYNWPYQYPYYQEKWFTKHPDTQIGLPPMDTHTQRAHNDYFQTWAELGIPGLLLMVWLLFIHFRITYQLIKDRKIPILGLFAAAATYAAMTRALFGFPFHEAAASCLFLGNLGLLSSVYKRKAWEWKPDWLQEKNAGNNHYGLVLLLIPLYLFALYPIYNYVVGNFSIQMYTRFQKIITDNHLWNTDPERAALYDKKARENLSYGVNRLPFVGVHLYLYANVMVANDIAPTATNSIHPAVEAKPNPNFNQTAALQAIEHYEKSLESYSFYDTYAKIGKVYRFLWENTLKPAYYEKAVQHYERAVSIFPVFERGWAQLALLEMKKEGESPIAWHTEARFPGFVNETLIPMAREAENQRDHLSASLL